MSGGLVLAVGWRGEKRTPVMSGGEVGQGGVEAERRERVVGVGVGG